MLHWCLHTCTYAQRENFPVLSFNDDHYFTEVQLADKENAPFSLNISRTLYFYVPLLTSLLESA